MTLKMHTHTGKMDQNISLYIFITRSLLTIIRQNETLLFNFKNNATNIFRSLLCTPHACTACQVTTWHLAQLCHWPSWWYVSVYALIIALNVFIFICFSFHGSWVQTVETIHIANLLIRYSLHGPITFSKPAPF